MAFSVIIPTRDMRSELELLLISLELSDLSKLASEIIIVDDGSKDETKTFLRERLSNWNSLKIITLNPSQGRFIARLKGAEAATTDHLLFIDTRIQLPLSFAANLASLMEKHQELMGVPFI